MSSHSYLSQEPLSRQSIKINSCKKTEIFSRTLAINLPASYLNASWGSRQDQSYRWDDALWYVFKASCTVPEKSFDINKETKQAFTSSIWYMWMYIHMNNMRLKVRRNYLLLDTCVQTQSLRGLYSSTEPLAFHVFLLFQVHRHSSFMFFIVAC